METQLQTFDVKDWTVFGRTSFQPPRKISDSLINEARIVHVLNGTSKLCSANQTFTLSSGDTLVMKSDNFVNQWQEDPSGTHAIVVVFNLTSGFLQHIYDSDPPQWFKPRTRSVTNEVEMATPSTTLTSFYDHLGHYLKHPEHLSEEVIKLKVKELIAILIQSDESDRMERLFGNLFNPPEHDFQAVIQKNLFEDLSLEDLAFLTGMSLSSFKRRFSSTFGTTPNKYITSKRLEKAQTLLSTSDLRISEIAYDCGFSDVGYFSKIFRNYYHITPSDFRKSTVD